MSRGGGGQQIPFGFAQGRLSPLKRFGMTNLFMIA
jgi:hypothetical protein